VTAEVTGGGTIAHVPGEAPDPVTPMTTDPDELRGVFESLAAALLASGRVEVNGFGVFELVRRKPSRARNPRTGDRIDVPAKTVVRFKPARALKARAAAVTDLP
jgi:nucleoid DNA-binding protein